MESRQTSGVGETEHTAGGDQRQEGAVLFDDQYFKGKKRNVYWTQETGVEHEGSEMWRGQPWCSDRRGGQNCLKCLELQILF